MTCDKEGSCSFVTRSLMDLFVAQRIFAEVANRDSELLATGQTSHETDWIIGQLARRHEPAVRSLVDWLSGGGTPVLRVNSAGILAKLGSPKVADLVIKSLQTDGEARRLYMTAVLNRVLRLDWEAAARVVGDLEQDGRGLLDMWPESRLAEAAMRFAEEVHNPRDSAARWCSVQLLGQLTEAAPDTAVAALQEALGHETSQENARAISAALTGAGPSRRVSVGV
jgi:hypothetical protein